MAIELLKTPTRQIVVIGAASGLGAGDTRCGEAPQALLVGGALAHLSARGVDASWRVTLHPRRGRGVRRMQAIASLCTRLASHVREALQAGDFPIVIGGDHSCA